VDTTGEWQLKRAKLLVLITELNKMAPKSGKMQFCYPKYDVNRSEVYIDDDSMTLP